MEGSDIFALVATIICMAAPAIIGKFTKNNSKKADAMLEDDLPHIPQQKPFVRFEQVRQSRDAGFDMTLNEFGASNEGTSDVYKYQRVVNQEDTVASEEKYKPKGKKIIDDPKKMVIYSEIMRPKYKE